MTKTMLVIFIAGSLLCMSAQARDKKTRDAALVGAGVGLVTDGVSSAAKGAVLGGGAGALASKDKGDRTNKYAGRGAGDFLQ